MNPPLREKRHGEALWKALKTGVIDCIATDHAPHTWEEKNGPYEKAHAGLPLVQHPLLLMLHYHKQGKISLEKIAEKMSHAVADCFRVNERGYIREGYHADLVIVDMNQPTRASKENILYKCGWSPLEGFEFPATVTHTFVNGHLVYSGCGNRVWDESLKGQRLKFDR
jgi:dihydroorotase